MKKYRPIHLRTRLIMTYMFIALLCIGFVGLLTNLLVNQGFQNYVKDNIEKKNSAYVDRLIHIYDRDKKFEEAVVQQLGVSALEEGVILKLTDVDGQVIWDAREHNNGLCEAIIENMNHNMTLNYPLNKGSSYDKEFPIISEGETVATLWIHYYGPFYLTDSDAAFLKTLNNGLLGVGLIGLMIAAFVGNGIARHMTRPIQNVISATQKLAKGHYSITLQNQAKDMEIGQLVESINELGKTLERQEKMRQQLTSDMAHEMRTPISLIQSHLEAMIDGIWEADLEHLNSCHEETLRMGRLVAGLESLARVDGQTYHMKATPFDGKLWLADIGKRYELKFKEKGLELNSDLEDVTIFGDKDLLSQAVFNLLDNAVKYTFEGGAKLMLVQEEEVSVITLSDTGIGIGESDLNAVFDKFYRVDPSRNRETGGFGIGLSIVKSIVNAHHGEIEMKSQMGQGTTISLKLPQSGF